MHIEYDETKNDANIASRGLSFERAREFDFSTARVFQDVRKDYPEARFVGIGLLDKRLHVLCFTPKAAGIRVISFRKANAREVRDYDQTHATD